MIDRFGPRGGSLRLPRWITGGPAAMPAGAAVPVGGHTRWYAAAIPPTVLLGAGFAPALPPVSVQATADAR